MRTCWKVKFVFSSLLFISKIYALETEKIEMIGVYFGAPYNPKKILTDIPSKVNCIVIDIKDDHGNITYTLDDDRFESSNKHEIKEIVEELKRRNIYTIARIVAFKDKIKTESDISCAICNEDGSIHIDKEKMSWLNPYNEVVHNYLIDIGIAAIKSGFDEVQYDYIRFSNYKTILDTNIKDNLKEKSKEEIILEFLKKAADAIHSIGGKISVDVFGCIIPNLFYNWEGNQKVLGQNYIKMAEIADYVCPMIYPSHFPYGFQPVQNDDHGKIKVYESPDLQPYEIINESLKASKESGVDNLKVRPWLQGFSASYLRKGRWKRYKEKEIQDQIKASVRNGISQVCIWNPRGQYKNIIS